MALDFKAPKSKFQAITQSDLFDSFEKTLDLDFTKLKFLLKFRTTYHSDLLTENDLTDNDSIFGKQEIYW